MGCVISLPLPLPWKPRRADTTSPTTARDESIRISDPVALGTIVRDTGTDGLDRERADALEESPEVMAAMDPRDESVAPGTSIAAPPSRSVDGSGESPEGTPILSAQTSSKRTGWLVLKRVLVAVKEGSDLFPPLKTALVGVLAVIDVVDCVGEAQDGFLAIARKIEGIQDIFSHYRSEGDIPFFVSKRLERLSAEFDSIKGIIETRMERGLLRRMIEAPGDVKDVESIFEALANMVERFKLDCSLNTELKVEDIAVANMLKILDHVQDASDRSQSAESCMEGTRVDILNKLRIWSRDPDAPRLFWVSGMAGTGKSAIARSLCFMLRQDRLLGGSFFCSRGTFRDDVKRILPTLAFSLAQQDARYKSALLNILRDHQDVAKYTVELQVAYLLEEPLRGAYSDIPTLILVMDALDECSDDKATERMLTELVSKSPHIPIKFFITSRPERHIRDKLQDKQPNLRHILRLHDVEENVVAKDISIYITARLQAIRDSVIPTTLPHGWPSGADIETLTHLAGKLFIYAFTAMEYIREEDPVERLQALTGPVVTAGQPFTGSLDEIYSMILGKAMDSRKHEAKEVSMTKRILSIILTLREPQCLSTIADLIGEPARRVRSALNSLHAVVRIPTQDDNGVVSTFHASFEDYLTTHERARDFFIDSPASHHDLTSVCLTVMGSDLLHFNVSQSASSYLPNSEQNIAVIPAHLIYSCSYWPHHIVAASDLVPLLSNLEEVLRQKFLFWIEVLSVVGKANMASSLIMKVLSAGSGSRNITQSLAGFLRDANSFIIFCREAIELSAPHIYLSALPAILPTSRIAEAFWSEYTNIPVLNVLGLERENQNEAFLHLQGHTGSVVAVAFSQDGTRIMSGSEDSTIRVWDASTGEPLVKPLEVHSSVTSVAFSQDGTRIASGSRDGTIWVWDVSMGETITKLLEGHSDPVCSVAFSQDGTRIVSGSDGGMIRVWDASTGKPLIKSLEGHSRFVHSVAFSPDGTRIISGCEDNTVRVWDTTLTDEPVVKQLNGHSGSVLSVAFSPDGTRIISSSSDTTIRVWDRSTGELLFKPLEGHSGVIRCVAFSVDGTRIASGSDDDTIKVWDASTGELLIEPLQGHSSHVCSVAFSPDGTRIVSGSWDNTIRVWDASAGAPLTEPLEGHSCTIRSNAFSQDEMRITSGSRDTTLRDASLTGEPLIKPLEGHSSHVRSVAFSPDGTRIASTSDDNTIRVWDASTGESLKLLEGHSLHVHSVVFSPDGTCIVLGSINCTIQVWDASTGKPIIKPLEGHSDFITSIAFSQDWTRIVSSSWDNAIRLWDASTGEPVIKLLEEKSSPVLDVALSPDGTRIVSSCSDGTTQVWDVSTGESLIKLLEGHSFSIHHVAFSPDGTRIMAGSGDGTIWLWDASTGKLLMEPLQGHSAFITSVAFSSDGTHILSSSQDSTIRVWDMSTGEPIIVLRQYYHSGFYSAALSPDETRIVSGSGDGMILVWDATIGNASTMSVAFSPYRVRQHSGTIRPLHDSAIVVESSSAASNLSMQSATESRSLTQIHELPFIDHSFELQSLYEEGSAADPRNVLWLHFDSGWIIGPRDELVLWVPQPFRSSLWLPRYTLMIGRSRVTYDLSHFVHGIEWTNCYTPRHSPARPS